MLSVCIRVMSIHVSMTRLKANVQLYGLWHIWSLALSQAQYSTAVDGRHSEN